MSNKIYIYILLLMRHLFWRAIVVVVVAFLLWLLLLWLLLFCYCCCCLCRCYMVCTFNGCFLSFQDKHVYIHVKHSCATGPFLNRRKLLKMPAVIGPYSANIALRHLVEQIVFSSHNSKDVLRLLAEEKTKMSIALIMKVHTLVLIWFDLILIF